MNISEETIDLYLRGDLSGSDLEAFNNAIASDPKLKQELDFQTDIVNSIKQYRHQQLKNRFNSIEIPAGGVGGNVASSIYLKFAASIGIVAALMGGTAIWLSNQTDEVTANNVTINSKSTTNNTEADSKSSESTKPSVEKVTKNPVSIQKENKNKITAPETLSKTKGNVENTDINSEDISTEQYSDHSIEDFEVPSITDGNTNSSVQNIKVNIVKEKDLAYRFFNNQLFLHGNFSNSTYELYELNTSPQKRLYLYFESNYYELIQGKTKVTALTPIKDKSTLNQLNQLRER